jgi:hypothetical protein
MVLLNNASQVDPRRLPFRAEDFKTIVHATKVERIGLVVVLVLEILICCLEKKRRKFNQFKLSHD